MDERYMFKNRKSYTYDSIHLHDNYKHLGYDCRGKILKNMTSPEIWSNPMQSIMIQKIETLIQFVLDETKSIKKQFSIAHNKNATNIN
ncbi:MAG: hypothetical protein RSE41_02900 [Clostridia bacterium]